jgi:vancomycin resistance protein YoaR
MELNVKVTIEGTEQLAQAIGALAKALEANTKNAVVNVATEEKEEIVEKPVKKVTRQKAKKSEVKNETSVDEEVKEDSTKPQLSEEELRDNLKKDLMEAKKSDDTLMGRMKDTLHKWELKKLSDIPIDKIDGFRKEVLGE